MRRQLLDLAWPVRSKIAMSVRLWVLITGCYLLQGVFLAFILAALTAGGGVAGAMPWLIGFAAVVLARGGLAWLAEMAAQATALATKEGLRRRLLTRLIDIGPGAAARRKTGDLQTTIVAGVEALESYYSRYLPAVFVAIFGSLSVLVGLALVDWRSALLLGVFVGGLPIVDFFWLRWRMPKSSGIFVAMGEFGAYLLDSLQGIVTLKAFDAIARRRSALAGRAADLRRESMAALAVTLMRTGLTGLVTLLGIAVVLSFNSWRVAAGDLAPVALFMTLFLAREAFRPLERLEKEFHTAWSASGAAAPIAELLAAAPLVSEPERPASLPVCTGLSFENVAFRYEDDAKPALSSVSFTVAENEFVALVGPSGAGKSTVISLLLRLFDPQAGSIRIGGTDIRDLPLDTLRSLISVVSQDTYLFHGTIADNLRLARPAATVPEIQAAAKAAHIDAFIMSLPKGYETEIGERGAHLSGGQRQRIAIARALLKGAPILLLDEATSSVDPRNEKAIQDSLDGLARRRTTLVIAHRLSTIRKADRILVMAEGRIVEEGPHDQLERCGEHYSRLMLAQGEAA
jgi:ATP-binding cassette subfamily C protein CydD